MVKLSPRVFVLLWGSFTIWWKSHHDLVSFPQVYLFFMGIFHQIGWKSHHLASCIFLVCFTFNTNYDIAISQNWVTCFITHDWFQLHAMTLWHSKGILLVFTWISNGSSKIFLSLFCQDFIPTFSVCLYQIDLMMYHLLLLMITLALIVQVGSFFLEPLSLQSILLHLVLLMLFCHW